MAEKITVISIEDGQKVAERIAEMLNGKTFSVVSFHSAHTNDPTIWQNFSLKESKPIYMGLLFKVVLYPHRSLCFDVREMPEITFVDDNRIDMVRKISDWDKVTRIILIN